MRRIFKITALVLLALVSAHCQKENNSADVEKPKEELMQPENEGEKPKDFTLEKNAVELLVGESAEVKILSGNQTYTIALSEGSNQVAEVTLAESKQAFVVKGIGKGKITASLTDTQKGSTLALAITVFLPEVPKQESLPKFKGTHMKTDEQLKTQIAEYVERYNSLIAEINKLPELPDDLYQLQKYAYSEGVKHIEGLKTYYKNNPNDRTVLEKANDEFHDFGVIYASIELLARKAEQFRKQYPNEPRVQRLVIETFDGLYTSQEGTLLHVSYDRDIRGGYNQLVELVNELNAKF
ncbi:MAG: GAG-binding domain-containing protein [Capnocytophaga sp.]|nr:GAG-binding domain-containing protein [Capnocytophaga sp.]